MTVRTCVLLASLLVLFGASFQTVADTAPVALSTPNELRARMRLLEIKVFEAVGALQAIIAPRQKRFVAVSPGHKGTPIPELTQLFQQLYLHASMTKDISAFVCADEAAKSLCGPKFEPVWLSDSRSMEPTLESLNTWTRETEAALDPLWRRLCQLAVTKTGKPSAEVCPDPQGMKLPWDPPPPD